MCLVQSMCPHVVLYVWQALPGLLVKQRVLLHWQLLFIGTPYINSSLSAYMQCCQVTVLA